MNKALQHGCDVKYLPLAQGREVSRLDHTVTVHQAHKGATNTAKTAWRRLLDFDQIFPPRNSPFWICASNKCHLYIS